MTSTTSPPFPCHEELSTELHNTNCSKVPTLAAKRWGANEEVWWERWKTKLVYRLEPKWLRNIIYNRIRRPLSRGAPGCEEFPRSWILDFVYFHIVDPLKGSSFISHVSCLMSQVLFNGLMCPKKQPTYHPLTTIQDLGWPRITRKIINFQASLQGNKNHENW